MSNPYIQEVKTCRRCGGQALYWPDAIVPGDPVAPRGSRRAVAHHQPAWLCVSCGHLEAEERRVVRSAERQGA
jgi:ribosomal protein L37E